MWLVHKEWQLLVQIIIIFRIQSETIDCPKYNNKNTDASCSCDSQIGGEICTLRCEQNECRTNANITCRNGDDCEIFCDGDRSCWEGTITCPQNAHCTVHCGSDQRTCDDLIIYTNQALSYQCNGSTCPNTPNMYTMQPTAQPTNQPTQQPSTQPSIYPTANPTQLPTTSEPTTFEPTYGPTINPSAAPTTVQPSMYPSNNPTIHPTHYPSDNPTVVPTYQPSITPSRSPSNKPSINPTTMQPSMYPTNNPTDVPSINPTINPSSYPSNIPSTIPTAEPTENALSSTTATTKSTSTSSSSLTTYIPTSQPTEEREAPMISSSKWSNKMAMLFILGLSPIFLLICTCLIYRGYNYYYHNERRKNFAVFVNSNTASTTAQNSPSTPMSPHLDNHASNISVVLHNEEEGLECHESHAPHCHLHIDIPGYADADMDDSDLPRTNIPVTKSRDMSQQQNESVILADTHKVIIKSPSCKLESPSPPNDSYNFGSQALTPSPTSINQPIEDEDEDKKDDEDEEALQVLFKDLSKQDSSYGSAYFDIVQAEIADADDIDQSVIVKKPMMNSILPNRSVPTAVTPIETPITPTFEPPNLMSHSTKETTSSSPQISFSVTNSPDVDEKSYVHTTGNHGKTDSLSLIVPRNIGNSVCEPHKLIHKKPKLDIINQSYVVNLNNLDAIDNRTRGISEAVDPNEREDSLIIFKDNSKPTNSLMVIKEKSVRFKMIFYDFDQTITVIHLYKELRGKVSVMNEMSDDRLYEIFGGKERVKRLKHHFDVLNARDIRLYILSFNFCAVIKEALERMDLLHYFDVIIGRDSEEMTFAQGKKHNFIQQTAEEYGYNECDILFVDDDAKNIKEALDTKCCKGLLIKERGGMNESHFYQIENGLIH